MPLDNPELFDALNKLDQLLTSFSEHSPKAAEAIFVSIGKLAERSPKTWNMILCSIMPIDSETIRRQPLHGFAGFAAPALLQGKGMVEEYRAWVKPWGLTFEQIHCPVMVWQSDADKIVPKHWPEKNGQTHSTLSNASDCRRRASLSIQLLWDHLERTGSRVPKVPIIRIADMTGYSAQPLGSATDMRDFLS